jgi:hypothetical protein
MPGQIGSVKNARGEKENQRGEKTEVFAEVH